MPKRKKASNKLVKKLEALYDHYRPDLSHLPTSDQILSGLLLPDRPMSFDESFSLFNQCLFDIDHMWLRYGKTTNSLIKEKLNNFYEFLLFLPIELRIVAYRELSSSGIDLTQVHMQEIFDNDYSNLLS